MKESQHSTKKKLKTFLDFLKKKVKKIPFHDGVQRSYKKLQMKH
jgi:hypothetical protein